MRNDGYTPLIDREREPKSRVHEELTEPARERLSVISREMAPRSRDSIMKYLMKKVGKSPLSDYIKRFSSGGIDEVHHDKFIMEGKTLHVLTYIELLVKYEHRDRLQERGEWSMGVPVEKQAPIQSMEAKIGNIRDVLITEGILWDIESVGEGGVIQFTLLESDGMREIDEKLQAISEDQPWRGALKGYNAAFDRYLAGDFDELIPKKLYNSIEELLKTICIDEEGWTDNRELVHSEYLDLLKEHGVYDAHGVTAPELGSLLDSLDKMVAKVSDDRKQRHVYHDRAYATLLIHQVGAYLYFLINRYEEFRDNE
ncbi:hypothetical protein [Halorientalis salina]|uniref:hypothetical protein n=1 Tax=Halorientalis salina TaxID=2932266 RepID=UPI0010AD6D74|nr:hypothetical protein [Halorientalis salina]